MHSAAIHVPLETSKLPCSLHHLSLSSISTKGGPNRPGYTYTSQDWNPSTEEDAIKTGGAGAFSYSVSKKLAEKAAFDFVEKEKPGFKIATFNPPMIYGKTEQPGVKKSNLNTSSKTIYNASTRIA